jgi:hypothetical protein
VCFVSNRRFLARAVQLGLHEVYVTRPDAPIVARDPRRLYVWMPLEKGTALPARPDAVRIESAASLPHETPIPQPTHNKRTPSMPDSITNGRREPLAADPTPDRSPAAIAELLSETEELRTVVLDASARLARLIAGLKQHRRQSRALQTAMQTLRQLNLEP